MEDLIRCIECKELKPRKEYYNSKRNASGKHSYCKSCHTEKNRKYYKGSSETHRKRARFLRFGLTPKKFDEWLLKQEGKCALCETKLRLEVGNSNFTVDHDHNCCPPGLLGKRRTCGKCVRGILCKRCNMMLGHYEIISKNPKLKDYLGITEA